MNKLRLPLITLALLLAACGKSEESVAKKTGDKVGGTVTDFVKGVGEGIDKKLVVNADLSPELANSVSMTVAKTMDHPGQQGISIYLIDKIPCKAKLMAKALNKDGLEIGRAFAEVEFAADEAKYVSFVFDNEMDTRLVNKYLVDLKK